MYTGTPWQLFLALCATSCFLENPAALDVRVVDWNPSGSDWNLGNDIPVAETVIELVDYMDAQIVTLQEVTLPSLEHLEASLPGWACARDSLMNLRDIGASCFCACARVMRGGRASPHRSAARSK